VRRTVNSTGRIKVEVADLKIRKAEDGTGVDIEFVLSDARYAPIFKHPNLAVFVTVGGARMRQPVRHEVEWPRANSKFKIAVPSVNDLKLRFDFIDRSSGLLLGRAENVRFSDGENADATESGLPVVLKDLGHLVWKLDLTTEPELQLNSRFPTAKELLVADPSWSALILPEVFRRVLGVCQDHASGTVNFEEDPESNWRSRWIALGGILVGEPCSNADDPDCWSDWVDTAVARFAERHSFVDLVIRENEK
jgi:hypothetical protein